MYFSQKTSASALIAGAAVLALCTGRADADRTYCANGATLSPDQQRCSDGSLPIYIPDAVQAAPAPRMVRSNMQHHPNPGFFRTWYLFVPGTVYEGPSSVPGYDVLTTSYGTGVLHKLSLFRNGTYEWQGQSQRPLIGRWQRGNADYPIILPHSYEGVTWSVKWDPNQNCIFVSNGDVWFEAKP